MTLMDRGISVGPSSATHPGARPHPGVGQSYEVRWSSLRSVARSSDGGEGMVRHEFVLRVQVINHEHALVEAWVETQTSRTQIFDRQPMRITLASDERAMHMDVFDERQASATKIASLSIPHAPPDASASAIYAQSSLLRKAGFAAGTHDRPMLAQNAKWRFLDDAGK